MNTKDTEVRPTIAGVPEEVQKNIQEDIRKDKEEYKSPQETLKIGISISDNEDLSKLGYGKIHLKDLLVEIVRCLLINDIILIYGGDLRKEGYTELLAGLAYQYRSVHESKKAYFRNYFAYPIYCQLSRGNELDFKKNRTEIVKVQPPIDLKVEIDRYFEADSVDNKYIWARSLTKMRVEMIADTNARILVGGKLNDYFGKVPGLLEEAEITLRLDKPLYLVGAFGGTAACIAKALKGENLSFMEDPYHTSEAYSAFKQYYNERQPENPIDMLASQDFLKNYSMERLSANNGLTEEENERLFVTPHVNEILYLIFKGFKKITGI